MRLLQRYVMMELLRVFSLLVSGLTVLLVIVGVVGEASKHGLGPAQIRDILPYIVPSLLPFTIPATLLLPVCVVSGRMAAAHEIPAVKAAGINALRLMYPSFILGACLSLTTFILTDQFIPWARHRIEQIITLAMEDIILDMLRTRGHVTDMDHGIIIAAARVEGEKLINPTFRYTPHGGRTITVQAQEATLEFDLKKREVIPSLYLGHVETPGELTISFEYERRPFPLPTQIEVPHARNITIRDIRQEMKTIERARTDFEHRQLANTVFALSLGQFERLGSDEYRTEENVIKAAVNRYHRLHTEVHSRLALACSCFFFCLLGTPFSVVQGRRQFLTSFFLCFVPILLIYYPLVVLSMTLGKNAKFNPMWGMWIGNIVLGAVALYVLRRVLKH